MHRWTSPRYTASSASLDNYPNFRIVVTETSFALLAGEAPLVPLIITRRVMAARSVPERFFYVEKGRKALDKLSDN